MNQVAQAGITARNDWLAISPEDEEGAMLAALAAMKAAESGLGGPPPTDPV